MVLVTIMVFLPARAAGPWYVALIGSDSSSCLTPTAPCATINGAISKAVAGDTIYIAEGIYTSIGGEQVILADKDLTLSGGWDNTFTMQNNTSTIDGQGGPRGLTVVYGVTVLVERLMIKNGGDQSGDFLDYGGGIFNTGNLTLLQSTITGNISTYGGGVNNYYGGQLTLVNVDIHGNTARGAGGGILNSGTLTVTNSSIINNDGATGGGIYNDFEKMVVVNNSTISGNHTGDRGGGIFNLGTTIVNNSTISYNNALIPNTNNCILPTCSGGGIYNQFGTLSIRNTIISANSAFRNPDCGGTLTTFGYNLIGNTTDCTFTPTTGDLHNINPRLFGLIASPGYHPLLRGSPAIDAGNPNGCTDQLGNPLNTDQRGVVRAGRCDIGAYEYDSTNDPLTYLFLPLMSKP